MAASQAVTQVIPMLVRMAHRPGGFLLGASSIATSLFTLAALGIAATGDSVFHYLPISVALLLWLVIAIFAGFREFLRRSIVPTEAGAPSTVVVDETGRITSNAQLATLGDNSSPTADSLAAEAELLGEAYREATVRTARFFPRIEAAQRALLQASGGLANAPYLRCDLRLVFGSAVATGLAIPIASMGLVLCLLTLLFG